MKKTPGQILVEMLDRVMVDGEDPTELQEELQKATCDFFNKPGTKVSCGGFEASDGGPVKKRGESNDI